MIVYVDAINYRYPKPNAGVTDLLKEKGPMVPTYKHDLYFRSSCQAPREHPLRFIGHGVDYPRFGVVRWSYIHHTSRYGAGIW